VTYAPTRNLFDRKKGSVSATTERCFYGCYVNIARLIAVKYVAITPFPEGRPLSVWGYSLCIPRYAGIINSIMSADQEEVELKDELKKLNREVARLQAQIADLYRLVRK
jgi:hypothetical protein